MLLAVDGANGGELAGLEQVLVSFEVMFHYPPAVVESAEAIALLCEAGFVEYAQEAIGLTPHGRKLLRRAGLPESPDRPRKVAHLLSEVDEMDLAPEGSVPAPTEDDVASALETLNSDQRQGVAPELGADLAGPAIGASMSIYGGAIGSSIFGGTLGGVTGRRWRVDLPPAAPEAGAPTVAPLEDGEDEEDEEG